MEPEESVPELMSRSGSPTSDDDSDWKEIDSDDVTDYTNCLFCPLVFRTTVEAVSHCNIKHNFDLVKLKSNFKMDCYDFIKLVNYIHIHQPDPSVIMGTTKPLWLNEEYMKPAKPDDPWLMYDFDDIEVPCQVTGSGSSSGGFHVNAEDGRVTLSEQHFAELQRTIQQLTLTVQEKQSELDKMTESMEKMRCITQDLVAGSETCSLVQSVKDVKMEDDEGYFNTYSHFSIHHEMLSDQVRTLSYRNAIMKNSSIWKGKTILDLGCGTGILSMFAATAGAEKVISIDQSDIIYHAMDIVRENNLADKIQLVKGRLEDTELPQNSVDVIVSEWMGYFLLFEGMLDSVIYARDHHLAPGGLLLPNRCSVSLVGLGDSARHAELIGFWTDVYGYQMTCLKHEVVREATVEVVPEDKIITTTCVLTELDLYKCTTNSVDFTSDLNLEVTTDGSLTGLVGYFDVFFDLPDPVSFSTGPCAQPTHWKQTVFLFEETIPVKRGDVLSGKVTCQRNQKDIRSLNLTISLLGKRFKYILN